MERDYATSNASKEVDSPYRPEAGYTGGERRAQSAGDECDRSCDMRHTPSRHGVADREGEGEGEGGMDEEEYHMLVRVMVAVHITLFLSISLLLCI